MKVICHFAVLLVLPFLFACAQGYPIEVSPTNSRSVIEKSDPGGLNERIVVFKVTGKGVASEDAINKGEAILLAERAAVLDGYRQLSEKLRGALVDSYSRRTGTRIDMDKITAQTHSYLKGVKVTDITAGEYGIYSAHMEVRVLFIHNELLWWPSGLGNNVVPYLGRKARKIYYYYATPATCETVKCASYPWCGTSYYYNSCNLNK